MKKIMKYQTLLVGISLLCAAGTAVADHHMTDSPSDHYRANEFDVDLFGGATVGQTTLEHLSRRRIRDNGNLGAGVGISYFITRYVGIGADAYTESTADSIVDSASANVIFRLPLGQSGVAPYIFGGGGRQFDPTELWLGQFGGGLEYRFNHNVGVFADGRYVMADGTSNYGLFRLGLRLAF